MEKTLSLPMAAISFLVGICVTLLISELPPLTWLCPSAVIAFVGMLCASNKIFKALCIAILGFSLMIYHAQAHLAKNLPLNLEAQRVSIVGTIVSIVEYKSESKAKFLFKIDHINHPTDIWSDPGMVQLSWAASPINLEPGDKWQLTVKLKRPRNYANPGSFDSEKFSFQNRIVANGYVVAKSRSLLLESSIVSQPINRLRQKIMLFITHNLATEQFAGVLLALVLGTKAKMSIQQWDLFQNTGTAHLMSISGLHIGLIASMIFWLLRITWRFVPRNFLRMPASWLAACGTLAISLIYGLLAGFSIATQRALIMLTVFLMGILLKRKVSPIQSYSLAILLILLVDPFAVLSLGFWLSFFAVGLLLYALRGRTYKRWLQPQIVMSLGLVPVSLLFFARFSIIAPLANIIVIPWVSFSVMPLALAAILMLPLNSYVALQLLKIAEYNFALIWPLLEKFNRVPVYVWQTSDHCWSLVCAVIAVAWLFIPKGLPGRYWGLLGLMPLFFARTNALPYGHAEFSLLDVGQGLAAVVRTQNHVLVYDTGAKLSTNFDLGKMVVAPFLQAKGLKQIDTLMISHADNDHIGGALSLISKINTKEILISDISYLYQYNPKLCVAGREWQWDGVVFSVLHPGYAAISKKRNDHSCVLMIQAGTQKILLTGDIEVKSEQHLMNAYGDNLQADILLVPHHGSKTSSSVEFIQQVNPKYALIPVGYKNQYDHPKPEILARYQELQIPSFSTELDGAISLIIGDASIDKLKPYCYRRDRHKFWLAKPS